MLASWCARVVVLSLVLGAGGVAVADLAPPPHVRPVPPKPKPKPKPKPAVVTPTAPEAPKEAPADAPKEVPADPPKEAPAPSEAPAPAGTPKSAARLPDGTFVGTLTGSEGSIGTVRFVVVGGMLIDASVELDKGGSVALSPRATPYDPALSLLGRSDAGHVQLGGQFFDVERGSGDFQGTLNRRRTSGTWVAARR